MVTEAYTPLLCVTAAGPSEVNKGVDNTLEVSASPEANIVSCMLSEL